MTKGVETDMIVSDRCTIVVQRLEFRVSWKNSHSCSAAPTHLGDLLLTGPLVRNDASRCCEGEQETMGWSALVFNSGTAQCFQAMGAAAIRRGLGVGHEVFGSASLFAVWG